MRSLIGYDHKQKTKGELNMAAKQEQQATTASREGSGETLKYLYGTEGDVFKGLFALFKSPNVDVKNSFAKTKQKKSAHS